MTSALRQFRGQQKNDIPEYKMASRMPYGVVLHCGTFRSTWDLLIFICTIYVAALVPYQSVFKDSDYVLQKYAHSLINLSSFLLAVFIFDVILNFRTTFVSKSGNVVFNPSLISRNYIRSWFVIDLFAAIPIDLFTLFLNFPKNTLTSASNSATDIQVAYKLELLTQYGAIALTVSVLIFGMMAHWLACVWYLIGWNELNNIHRVINDTRQVGWLYELSNSLQRNYVVEVTNFTGGPTMAERYTTSLYFTLSSLTSVGFGNVSANTNNEKVFSVLVMLIGALMHAVVFGNVTAIIQRMYARRSQYDTRMRDMKEFFAFAQIDKNLQRRLIDYFNATWSKRKGMQQVDSTLQTFPSNLRGEIFQHLHSQFLNLPVFQYTSPSCRNFIALRVQRMFFTPDEFLVYEGDSLSHIYLVISGSMEVSRDGQITAIFGKGDLFGYDPKAKFIRESSRQLSCSYCDLQYISATTFHQLCKLFPEFTQRFINELSSDYSCNLWELHKPVDERENLNKRKNSQIPSVTGTTLFEPDDKKETISDLYEDEMLKASPDGI
ncbi:unnamed protein product [Oikopleura dioica]|uniref:Cyclic nucleotide-binding domain-containing protein n=3 Tax=Oikopleura dioica TaxID=34765 RepID=E4YNV3_OIKDI|nr:unnamed protein product [Oikopleura dioica]